MNKIVILTNEFFFFFFFFLKIMTNGLKQSLTREVLQKNISLWIKMVIN